MPDIKLKVTGRPEAIRLGIEQARIIEAVSPTIDALRVDDGAEITVEDYRAQPQTVEVKDGVGIATVEKTATEGLVDTYTITFTDGATTEFTVTNGAKGNQGLPEGGNDGDILTRKGSDDAQWVTPASSPEQDNTRPITAAAVYTEIGNINALLATI